LASRKTQFEQLREAESKLASDLAALRSRIRKAEAGENKRIKNVNKYIDRTNRDIAKFTREQEKIQEKELERIEKFLGDTFEDIFEAREALSKETRKLTKREELAYKQTQKRKLEESAARSKSEKERARKTKQAAAIGRQIEGRKLDPNKPSYKIRQLSELERQNVLDFLTDKKTYNQVGIGYLKPNERITVSVPYRYIGTDGKYHQGRALGRKIFRDWAAFQAYLIGYMGEDSTEEWLGDIEVIKFPEEYNYRVERGRQTDVINKRRKDVKKMFSEKEKAAKKKARESEKNKQAKLLAKKNAQIKQLKDKLKGRK
jgi:hypothetical protein